MALVAVGLAKVPQAVPLHVPPETLQVTPWLFTSPVRVAVKLMGWLWSMALLVAGDTATVMGGLFTTSVSCR